ncbi:ABC transporter, solute-binding protein [Paenibacillus sp. oral taxon 786 str. D14]|uniref:extracellular solute-binding protein n=1 Tax=Paenibacillus sp. oral taxon 786 TaxID=652715 RepID=UPI0001AFDCF6|nr:extracellular solute-binding protein [Paenibacillus sp. oral taxon 786]EES72358.1 ABC transporter, solute-binding protein [Paenibacillus sp. oral taxon 786 str. D14]
MKKKLFILLSLMLVVTTVLAACGGNNNGADNSGNNSDSTTEEFSFPLKEPVTIKMVACKHPNNGPYEEMEFFKQLEEKTNVKIDWDDIDYSACEEQRNLILGTNDLPDAFYGNLILPANDVIKYGAEGALIPLEDYITEDIMPNLYKLLEENPTYRSILTAPDGHIYSLPNIRELMLWLSPDMMFLNKVWLDNLDLEVPTTTEELYDVLMAFKTQDPNGNGEPDEIPFSFVYNHIDYNTQGIGSLFGAFGRADWSNHLFVEDGKVVFSAQEPEYKEAIKYFHKFFADGLFDKESLTQDNSQLIGKADRLGGFFAWLPFSVVGAELNDNYVAVPALEGPNGDRVWRKTMWNNMGVNPTAFSVTSVNEHPELTMRWIDLHYDPETSIEAGWGPIGLTLVEKDGQLVLNDPPEGMTIDEYVFKTAPVEAPYAIQVDTYGGRLALAEKDKEKIDTIKENYLPYMTSETIPGMLYSPEENEQIKLLSTDINSYVMESSARWLLEGTVEEEWDEYLNNLKKMGIDDLLAVYQQAYDRFLSAQ